MGPIFSALLLPSTRVDAQASSVQGVLEEIVVTARRREESLQDLPMSAAALTAEALAAEGIYDIEQVGELVPNLTLKTGDRNNHTRVIIRGIGGGHGDPTFPFGTGMYIDGHYIPNSVGGFMSTLDIERVEVLRGPQGTLFGKNTTGGAVNIISTKPSPESEFSLTARLGELGQQDLRGMANFPISENVFARISAASEQLDGYYYNRNLQLEPDWIDHSAFRGALRFTPGEHWTIDTSLSLSEYRDGESGGQCAPGARPWGLFGEGGALYGDDAEQTQTYAICNTDRSLGAFVNSSGKRAYSNVDTEGLFFSAAWDSGGGVGGLADLNVTANASYRSLDYEHLWDRDYMALPVLALAVGTGAEPRHTHTRGAELLIDGTVNERLAFVTGAHYFYEETSHSGSQRCFDLFDQLLASDDPTADVLCEPFSGLIFEVAPTGGFGAGNQTVAQNTSLGIFGHLTYALNDRWELEAGIRYTEDERVFTNLEFELINIALPDPTALITFDAIMNDFTVFAFNGDKDTFSDVTPTLSFTRALESRGWLESGMLYLRYSQGFLTGSFNTELPARFFPSIQPLVSYGPEHVDNYEVGFKGTFAGGRLRMNGAVFYMDYTDKQDEVFIDNTDGRYFEFAGFESFSVTTNVSEVEIYGVELELRAQPWDGGLVTLDLGYLHNEYGQYETLNENLELVDLAALSVSDLSPDWTANWRVEHTFTLSDGATLTPMLGVYWQTDYEWLEGLEQNSPPSFCHEGNYAKWRIRLSYEPPTHNFRVTLYGDNITDERIYEYCNQAAGLYLYRYEQPATWGLEFSARWGG